MLVKQAKMAAEEWVHQEGSKLPGLKGAYLAGSVTTLADKAHLPETSDVDVTIVMEDPPARKPGKFRYRGRIARSVIGRMGDNPVTGRCPGPSPSGRWDSFNARSCRPYGSPQSVAGGSSKQVRLPAMGARAVPRGDPQGCWDARVC